MLLTHGGQLAAAEEACQRLLAIDELNAGAHYVLALCREHAGERERAMEHDRVAAHLDPAFAMPRLHCGLLARHAGDRDGARRELAQALVLLKREDVSRLLLFGGGFTRDALIALCQSRRRGVRRPAMSDRRRAVRGARGRTATGFRSRLCRAVARRRRGQARSPRHPRRRRTLRHAPRRGRRPVRRSARSRGFRAAMRRFSALPVFAARSCRSTACARCSAIPATQRAALARHCGSSAGRARLRCVRGPFARAGRRDRAAAVARADARLRAGIHPHARMSSGPFCICRPSSTRSARRSGAKLSKAQE